MNGLLVVLLVCVASTQAQPQVPIDLDAITKPIIDKFNEGVQNGLINLLEQIKNLIPVGKRDQSFQDKLQEMLQASLDHMKDILSQFASQSIDKVIGYVTAKPAAKRDVLQNVNDFMAQLGQALSNHVSNIGQSLADHGNNVAELLKPHLDNLKDQLTQHGLNAAQSILDALANASGSLSG
jgi:hypothetical protein